ncbi:MAG TPA: RNA polymerase sigma factor [Candidatus Hydrogenedentes bacterium]|nr:RNA polymerase sigma factor [Candidatus Hydrogenedentota bacterium]
MDTALDEKTLIKKARKGDRAAFSALVAEHQQRAYAVAYSFVRNREDALDMAQDAFVKAYQAIGRFDIKKPFVPWLYRIIKNTCLNHIERKKRHGETSLEEITGTGYEIEDNGQSPRGSSELLEQQGLLQHVLHQLSAEHREILRLRHLLEFSYDEIADELKIPKGTVMSRLHEARKNLRRALDKSKVAIHE